MSVSILSSSSSSSISTNILIKCNKCKFQWKSNKSKHLVPLYSLPSPHILAGLEVRWGCELTVDGRTDRKLDCSLSPAYRKDRSKLLKCEWKKWKSCTPGRPTIGLCHLKVLQTFKWHSLSFFADVRHLILPIKRSAYKGEPLSGRRKQYAETSYFHIKLSEIRV